MLSVARSQRGAAVRLCMDGAGHLGNTIREIQDDKQEKNNPKQNCARQQSLTDNVERCSGK